MATAPRRLPMLLLAVVLSSSYVDVSVAQGLITSQFSSYCSTTGNYTWDSQYGRNLRALVIDLPARALDNRGYYNGTAGELPDQVFGLISYYAGSRPSECYNCLYAAVAGIEDTCPFSRQMKGAYFSCVVHYSNESFLSVADLSVGFYTWYNTQVDDPDNMNNTRWALLTRLVAEAARLPLPAAAGERERACTRDLNASECSRCLTKFVANLSSKFPNNTFAGIKGYSCYAIYCIGDCEELQLRITAHPPPSNLPPEAPPLADVRTSSRRPLVAGVSGGVIVMFVISSSLLVCFLLCRRRRNRMARQVDTFDNDPLEEDFEKGTGPKQFRYSNLALGEGGLGSVYKGLLQELKVEVAIKRVSKTSKQVRKEYISEVKIISRLKHRNIVQLIGWCHGGGELLLVYGLMPHGSLDTHLYSPKATLLWPFRYEIVLGLGSALSYLHQDWEQCVLHRDIKPSNIMLDASFCAKLGDFGLARLVDHDRGPYTTGLCVVTGRTNVESDVYSFGVVMLEIACGKGPAVARGQEDIIHLVQWVWDSWESRSTLEAADAQLNLEFDEWEVECVMVVGLWCVHPDRTLRLLENVAENKKFLRFTKISL
ncbi:hypothetical protein VPH35_071514 [Triticum aestivum]